MSVNNPKPMPTNEVEKLSIDDIVELLEVGTAYTTNIGLVAPIAAKIIKELRSALEKYASKNRWSNRVGGNDYATIFYCPNENGYEIAQTVLNNLKGK